MATGSFCCCSISSVAPARRPQPPSPNCVTREGRRRDRAEALRPPRFSPGVRRSASLDACPRVRRTRQDRGRGLKHCALTEWSEAALVGQYELQVWADSAPSEVASGRTEVHAIAVIPLRTWSTL